MLKEGSRASCLLDKVLTRPRLQGPGKGRPRRPVKRIIVFGRMPNPTFDYYLAARLEAPGMPPFQVCDIRSFRAEDLEAEGSFVLICRYASTAVLRWIESRHANLAGVGLFLDDDIPAVITGDDADLPYRLFLWYRAIFPLRRLNRHLDCLWLSTPRLADAIGEPGAKLLPPAPPERLWRSASFELSVDQVVIAYHATGVHVAEHHFLRPIIETVLAARPQARFEVVAGPNAAGIWQGLERCHVLSPTSWTDYLEKMASARVDIFLVPLTPSAVNDCRAPTKRIDAARLNAAGLYSASPSYGFGHDRGEIHLAHEAEDWVRAILALIDNPAERKAVAAATCAEVAAMTALARDGLPGF
ncbi:hypothetical protein [Rhizobium paknamense]|uniref:Glycosyltransferase family 1 protein n=1 Tax=Rhizobium paknamense TaxID=1206817 RepID=A0ABU0I7I0_9HYPH|nr:hypothetical protein [Rhizobium paknamense]MDQ0454167.1 hypothetical protein [Rhizobium paknamense]